MVERQRIGALFLLITVAVSAGDVSAVRDVAHVFAAPGLGSL